MSSYLVIRTQYLPPSLPAPTQHHTPQTKARKRAFSELLNLKLDFHRVVVCQPNIICKKLRQKMLKLV